MRLHALVRESRIRAIALCAIAAVPLCATDAMGAEIKVLASANAGLRSALAELAPRFERETGYRVDLQFASAVPMKQRIDAGETFDLVISPGLTEELVRQGKVAADTRATFASTGLGVGVRKGAAKPDIGSAEAFKRTLLNATSVGYGPDTEPGILFLAVLDRLGIAQDMRPRLKALSLQTMLTAVDKGEVEIVVSSITNLVGVADVVALPPEIQRTIDFSVAVSATTKEPDAAKTLLRFLLSPTATAVFTANGFHGE